MKHPRHKTITTLKAALFCAALGLGAGQASAAELLLNGTFTTTPALNNTSSNAVGRAGSGQNRILDNTDGTNVGWQTTAGSGLFEVWAPGFAGSPAGVGNTLELANNAAGFTTYQIFNSSATASPLVTFSFGYAPRDSGTDAFTAQLLDVTTNTTLFSQAFNPTGSFATNQTFSTAINIAAGDVLRVNFIDQNTNPNASSAHIDSVSVNQVPEPSTWALLGLGASAFGLTSRQRRRTKLV